MISINQLTEEELDLFIKVISVYQKHLRVTNKTSVSMVYNSVINDFKKTIEDTIINKCNIFYKELELPTHTAIVFANAILYYLCNPEKEYEKCNYLKTKAIKLINQIKSNENKAFF